MHRLSISLLRSFDVNLDGHPVSRFESDKVRALLAFLAIESDRPHRRETLAGLLWPDRPERRARRNLSQALFNLRQVLGDWDSAAPLLRADRQTLHLAAQDNVRVDVLTFLHLIDQCPNLVQSDKPCQYDVCPLSQAIALYQSDLLPGFSVNDSPLFEEWLLMQRERLHRLAFETLQHLVRCSERRGNLEQVIDYARRWIELEPWQEQAHRRLMRALALSGKRTSALAQYELCASILKNELDVAPDGETTRLYEQIRDGVALPAAQPDRPPPLHHNLPAQIVPFVGRENVLDRVNTYLRDPDCRMLTLFGPGGIGKTRLALEVAQQFLDGTFTHGVYVVPLVGVGSVDGIVPAIADAIGFSPASQIPGAPGAPPQQQLLDYLRDKRMLLVLDNFEHLLHRPGSNRENGIDVLAQTLETAPAVKLLVTSRARLNALGEQLMPLAGLSLPPQNAKPDQIAPASAVRLFLTTARRARPGFIPSKDDLIAIAHICYLVQGMPLAIILAAGWIEMMSPTEIATEMAQRLDFLSTDYGDVPERQRSMRAVFDHSWRLLDERRQQILAGLSVFRGSFTRQAAQHVTGATLRELMSLVNQSRLHRTPGGRFEVHELLRQYAAEKLNQLPGAGQAVRDEHCAYYSAKLQQWAADLKGTRQQAALSEIEANTGNVHTAWEWAIGEESVERLAQAMEGVGLFCDWGLRYEEGETTFRTAAGTLVTIDAEMLTASGERLRVQSKLLSWQGLFCRQLGRTESARRLLEQSLDLLDEPALAGSDTRQEKAFALQQIGLLEYWSGDRRKAQQLLSQSVALYRALGDRWWLANALCVLAEATHSIGAYEEAKQLHRESLAIRRALGDQKGIAFSLRRLAFAFQEQGQLAEAEQLERQSIAICRMMGDQSGVANGLRNRGSTLHWLGKPTEAHPLVEECIAILNDLGDRHHLIESYYLLGVIKGALGQYQEARLQAHRGLTLARETGYQWAIGVILGLLAMMAQVEKDYIEAQRHFSESVTVLQRQGGQGEVSCMLAWLASVVQRLGHPHQAWQYVCEALQTLSEIRSFIWLLATLPAVALYLLDRGADERAIEVYALALRYPFISRAHFYQDVAGKPVSAVATTLPHEVVQAAQDRGRAQDPWTTVKNLLSELEADTEHLETSDEARIADML